MSHKAFTRRRRPGTEVRLREPRRGPSSSRQQRRASGRRPGSSERSSRSTSGRSSSSWGSVVACTVQSRKSRSHTSSPVPARQHAVCAARAVPLVSPTPSTRLSKCGSSMCGDGRRSTTGQHRRRQSSSLYSLKRTPTHTKTRRETQSTLAQSSHRKPPHSQHTQTHLPRLYSTLEVGACLPLLNVRHSTLYAE